MQADINDFSDADWQRTAYTLWLRTLRDLLTNRAAEPQAARYPDWWNTPAWQTKQLNAGLGSWAELRHDTILYVKQSYTVRLTAVFHPRQRKQDHLRRAGAAGL